MYTELCVVSVVLSVVLSVCTHSDVHVMMAAVVMVLLLPLDSLEQASPRSCPCTVAQQHAQTEQASNNYEPHVNIVAR